MSIFFKLPNRVFYHSRLKDKPGLKEILCQAGENMDWEYEFNDFDRTTHGTIKPNFYYFKGKSIFGIKPKLEVSVALDEMGGTGYLEIEMRRLIPFYAEKDEIEEYLEFVDYKVKSEGDKVDRLSVLRRYVELEHKEEYFRVREIVKKAFQKS